MLSKEKYDTYVNLLKEELVPAMGCTEPISIAYAVAKTKSLLNEKPVRGILEVSANIIKNANYTHSFKFIELLFMVINIKKINF